MSNKESIETLYRIAYFMLLIVVTFSIILTYMTYILHINVLYNSTVKTYFIGEKMLFQTIPTSKYYIFATNFSDFRARIYIVPLNEPARYGVFSKSIYRFESYIDIPSSLSKCGIVNVTKANISVYILYSDIYEDVTYSVRNFLNNGDALLLYGTFHMKLGDCEIDVPYNPEFRPTITIWRSPIELPIKIRGSCDIVYQDDRLVVIKHVVNGSNKLIGIYKSITILPIINFGSKNLSEDIALSVLILLSLLKGGTIEYLGEIDVLHSITEKSYDLRIRPGDVILVHLFDFYFSPYGRTQGLEAFLNKPLSLSNKTVFVGFYPFSCRRQPFGSQLFAIDTKLNKKPLLYVSILPSRLLWFEMWSGMYDGYSRKGKILDIISGDCENKNTYLKIKMLDNYSVNIYIDSVLMKHANFTIESDKNVSPKTSYSIKAIKVGYHWLRKYHGIINYFIIAEDVEQLNKSIIVVYNTSLIIDPLLIMLMNESEKLHIRSINVNVVPSFDPQLIILRDTSIASLSHFDHAIMIAPQGTSVEINGSYILFSDKVKYINLKLGKYKIKIVYTLKNIIENIISMNKYEMLIFIQDVEWYQPHRSIYLVKVK